MLYQRYATNKGEKNMKDFIFAIGDFVTHKESLVTLETWQTGKNAEVVTKDQWILPIRILILERRFQECSGGAQIHYFGRYYTKDGYKADWFNETELVIFHIPNDQKEVL